MRIFLSFWIVAITLSQVSQAKVLTSDSSGRKFTLQVGYSYWTGISKYYNTPSSNINAISKLYPVLTDYQILRSNIALYAGWKLGKRMGLGLLASGFVSKKYLNYRLGFALDYRIVKNLTIGSSISWYKYQTSQIYMDLHDERLEFTQTEQGLPISATIGYFFPIKKYGVKILVELPVTSEAGSFHIDRVEPRPGSVGPGNYPTYQFLKTAYISLIFKIL